MNCPKCGERELLVIDKRDTDCESVYRRRKCKLCGHRFTTVEYEVELTKGRRRNVK